MPCRVVLFAIACPFVIFFGKGVGEFVFTLINFFRGIAVQFN